MNLVPPLAHDDVQMARHPDGAPHRACSAHVPAGGSSPDRRRIGSQESVLKACPKRVMRNELNHQVRQFRPKTFRHTHPYSVSHRKTSGDALTPSSASLTRTRRITRNQTGFEGTSHGAPRKSTLKDGIVPGQTASRKTKNTRPGPAASLRSYTVFGAISRSWWCSLRTSIEILCSFDSSEKSSNSSNIDPTGAWKRWLRKHRPAWEHRSVEPRNGEISVQKGVSFKKLTNAKIFWGLYCQLHPLRRKNRQVSFSPDTQIRSYRLRMTVPDLCLLGTVSWSNNAFGCAVLSDQGGLPLDLAAALAVRCPTGLAFGDDRS